VSVVAKHFRGECQPVVTDPVPAVIRERHSTEWVGKVQDTAAQSMGLENWPALAAKMAGRSPTDDPPTNGKHKKGK